MKDLTLSKFFPAPTVTISSDGVKTYSYRRDWTEVKISHIPPGVSIAPHSHQEAQAGMVISGELEMTVGDVTKVMQPERIAYVVPPFVTHSARNTSDHEIVAIDIKRYKPDEKYDAPPGYFLEPIESRKLITLDVTFFLANWIELMIAQIPGEGGEMPYHKHIQEQIGVCLDGEYEMNIEGETCIMKRGTTYFCDSREYHGAINRNKQPSRSLNIFFPPRYHRVAKR